MRLASGEQRQSSITHQLHKAQTLQEQVCIFQTLQPVKVSVNRGVGFRQSGECFKSPLMQQHRLRSGLPSNTSVLLERAARLGFENTIVLFQLTFFFQQCVKG